MKILQLTADLFLFCFQLILGTEFTPFTAAAPWFNTGTEVSTTDPSFLSWATHYQFSYPPSQIMFDICKITTHTQPKALGI